MPSAARLAFLVLTAIAVVLPLRSFVAEPIVIASPSMNPTLTVGSLMILDKWSLLWREPRHGEIISFRSPIEEEDLVKRVIAIPGDQVEMKDKEVVINGIEQVEPYAVHVRAKQKLVGDTMEVMTVPAKHYFVLGDNRDESNDSSVWKNAAGERVYFVSNYQLQGVVRHLPWIR